MSVPKLPLHLLGLLPRYHRWYWRRDAVKHPFVDDWNREREAIFVHIPKTAGTSVFQALGQAPSWDTHAPNRAYEQVYPELARRAFRFSFVRNPWDRFASSFFFLKAGTHWELQRRWARRHIGDLEFGAFVRRLANPLHRANIRAERFFWPQAFWLEGARGAIGVDTVYRFEQLPAAIEEICDRLCLPRGRTIPQLRKTEKPVYRALYDKETMAIIANFYQSDIDLLGYDF